MTDITINQQLDDDIANLSGGARKILICALYSSGLSLRQVGKLVHRTHEAVRNSILSCGCEVRKR